MPTFSSILDSFPESQASQSSAPRRINAFMYLCLVVSAALFGSGFYWQQRALIYAAVVPLSFSVITILIKIVFELKDNKEMFKNPGGSLADGLDQRFAQEKVIAAELAANDLIELQRMKARLDADLIRTERWLDVLKLLSMLAPAVFILVTAGIFKLLDFIQDIFKVAVAAATVGAIAAAIAIHRGLVGLRTIWSTLHYAIELVEEKKKKRFRKVSRKRGERAA